MKTKITIGVFILMLVLCAVALALPADEQSVLNENRIPAQMPEMSLQNVFFGTFCEDFETYLSDNVGLRGRFIDFSNKISNLKGLKSFGYISNATSDLGTGAAETDKGLLVTNGKIMEVFKAKPGSAEKYVDMVNHYAAKLPEDVKLYCMIIPTQIEFEDEKFSSLADSQKETIDSIYEGIADDVICVDAYSALQKHRDEYIYFRTDHHWTTLGAYYAYKEFAADAGVAAPDISSFEENKADGFLGYLYNQAQATELKDKPDTIYYYTKGENLSFDAKAWEEGKVVDYSGKLFNIPTSGAEVKYSLFMGGDHSLLDIKTETQNKRTLLVLKDSYANAFMPWLVHSFQRVVAVDPRSFGGDIGEIIEEYDVTDVLLMNYTFTTTFDGIIELQKGIYK